eukprot:RCo028651
MVCTQPPHCWMSARMDGKVVIVTGANSGMGKQTTSALYGAGATVVMACRRLDRAQKAVEDIQTACLNLGLSGCGTLQVLPLDLSDMGSVRSFVDAFLGSFSSL